MVEETKLDTENRILKLEKMVKLLSARIKKLESGYDVAPDETTEEPQQTDIRVVILGMSLLGLVVTALYLFYKG